MKTTYKLIKEYPGSLCINTLKTVETHEGRVITANPNEMYDIYPEFWEEIISDYTGVCFRDNFDNLGKVGENYSTYKKWLERGTNKKHSICDIDNIHTLFTKKLWIQVPLEEYEAMYFPKVKEYEILSYKIPGNEHWEVTKQPNGDWGGWSEQHKDAEVLKGNWKIKQIKRLSDSVVFTLGDKVYETVTGKKDDWVIKEFSIKDTRCFSCGINITCFEHKTPLFITDDGKKIFGGDKFYFVDELFAIGEGVGRDYNYFKKIDKYKHFSTKEAAEKYVETNRVLFVTEDGVGIKKGDSVYFVCNDFSWNIIPKCQIRPNPDLHYFSSQKEAEKYIEMNKPKYSLVDIYKAYETYRHLCFTTDDFIKKLK